MRCSGGVSNIFRVQSNICDAAFLQILQHSSTVGVYKNLWNSYDGTFLAEKVFLA